MDTECNGVMILQFSQVLQQAHIHCVGTGIVHVQIEATLCTAVNPSVINGYELSPKTKFMQVDIQDLKSTSRMCVYIHVKAYYNYPPSFC